MSGFPGITLVMVIQFVVALSKFPGVIILTLFGYQPNAFISEALLYIFCSHGFHYKARLKKNDIELTSIESMISDELRYENSYNTFWPNLNRLPVKSLPELGDTWQG